MDSHPEVLVPFFVFFFVAAIIIVPIYLRSRERKSAIEAIKLLAEKGAATPPELMKVLQQERRFKNPDGDLKFGLLALAVCAAMITSAVVRFLLSDDPTPHIRAGLIGGAAFPGFVGLVLIGFWAYSRRRRLDD
jgi:hypothetical protein